MPLRWRKYSSIKIALIEFGIPVSSVSQRQHRIRTLGTIYCKGLIHYYQTMKVFLS